MGDGVSVGAAVSVAGSVRVSDGSAEAVSESAGSVKVLVGTDAVEAVAEGIGVDLPVQAEDASTNIIEIQRFCLISLSNIP
jgi:hypothetical protein